MTLNADQALFSIRNASVVRGGKTILQVPSFTLREGERIALLGPNGAGKSTFVQLLTREALPLHQEEPPLLFQGNARPTLADVKSFFGVVSATMHNQLRVHVPALHIVCGGMFGALGLPQRVQPSSEQVEKALGVMGQLGIASLAQQDVCTLSTGQARRVLIAREMAHNPQAFIFDEPCTGLDPEGMYYVRKAMRRLAQEGKTLVLVTHYAEDIVPEIDRVAFVKDARLVADGPKEGLLTSENVSSLFDVPLEVQQSRGWYALQGRF